MQNEIISGVALKTMRILHFSQSDFSFSFRIDRTEVVV